MCFVSKCIFTPCNADFDIESVCESWGQTAANLKSLMSKTMREKFRANFASIYWTECRISNGNKSPLFKTYVHFVSSPSLIATKNSLYPVLLFICISLALQLAKLSRRMLSSRRQIHCIWQNIFDISASCGISRQQLIFVHKMHCWSVDTTTAT